MEPSVITNSKNPTDKLMNKSTLLAIVLLCLGSFAFAQAPVPTSWDFENFSAPPQGWTFTDAGGTGGTTYTSTNSCGSQALRLDADNDQLVIFFGQQPGPLTYTIKGMGNSWDGIFRIQESTDGTTWVNMTSYVGPGAIATSCTTVTANPANALSRYYRFWYEDKVPGSNVALDDVQVANPSINTPTLAVSSGTNQVFHNTYAPIFSSPVSTPLTLTYSLKNLSVTGNLLVDSIRFTGSNNSDYAVDPSVVFPISIAPNATFSLPVIFTPQLSGTRLSDVNIYSNSSLHPQYILKLYGAGGSFASEPAGQSAGITFPINKTYRTIAVVQESNPAPDFIGGYLVLRSTGNAPNTNPADGVTYERGQSIGNAKVIYNGAIGNGGISIRPTWVHAGLTYHFRVYTFNGDGNITNYNTTSPTSDSITTPASMMASGEYTNIDPSNPGFITTLSAQINQRQTIFYSNYAPTMINLFEARDTMVSIGTSKFFRVLNCAYSGLARPYNEPFDWTAYDFSREHTYAHSWMPTFDASSPERPEYNDQHNLYPTKQSNVNAVRCNYPLGVVVSQESNYLLGKLGLDANGRRVYEPRDVHKGRAARAMMYMAVCYNGISGNSWGFNQNIGVCGAVPIPYGQDQNILKRWNLEHMPDAYDMARNDFLDSLQQNRNPFVDHPEWACQINFINMSYIANPPITCYEIPDTNCNAPNFSIDTTQLTTAQISWNAVSGATTYTLQYKASNASTWITQGPITSPFTISNLQENTTYVARMFSTCGNTNSDTTAEKSFTTKFSNINEVFSTQWQLYPNPANDILQINFSGNSTLSNTTLVITDITGKQLLTRVVESKTEIISLTGLSKGMYLLHIYREGMHAVKRFGKQ
jgi:endonuclease I